MVDAQQVLAGAAIEADALVLLVGPAGAGKSTWAAGRFEPGQVLSSDRFRAMVAGDAADQAANADAFRVLHAVLAARLRRGLLCVVDATNLTAAARGTLVRMAGRAHRPVIAIVFDISLARCLRQNALRVERQVPEPVVRRQYDALQVALDRIPHEGFAEVRLLRDADMETG